MFNDIKIFFILSVIFIVIDSIYLKTMSSHFQNLVKKIQGGEEMKFRYIPAIFCYFFLVFGLQYFIINKNGTILDAAILGWVIYGVYETTNAVIFKDWDLKSIIIDTIWGGILYALTTIIYYNIISNNFIKV